MDSRPPLRRQPADRVFAGVCSGLAEHLGFPVMWVRGGFAVATLAGGAGVVLYLFLYLTVPGAGESEPVLPLKRVFTPPSTGEPRSGSVASRLPIDGERPASRTQDSPSYAEPERGSPPPSPEPPASGMVSAARRVPVAEILLGGALLLAGVMLLLHQVGVGVRLEVVLPGLAASVGIGLSWWLIADRGQTERHQLPRVLGALALVAVGVIMFFITANQPTVVSVIGAALAVLAGVSLAILPWLLRLNRELGAERAARARETERTEIAAHLHDSVLQTLALIQQRSEPGTEVARLARGQERELREWLFRAADGPVPQASGAAATLLTDFGAALEHQYAARFEVIAVGERAQAPEAILAAAKEAMTNAARHAGGQVTVYLETSPTTIRIEVNDRGPGFDPESTLPGRFGVKESILGRMERAGGSAQIAAGPGGEGTSVRLEQRRDSTSENSETIPMQRKAE